MESQWKALVAAIIRQAVNDAKRGIKPQEIREFALSDDLKMYCDFLELDYKAVAAKLLNPELLFKRKKHPHVVRIVVVTNIIDGTRHVFATQTQAAKFLGISSNHVCAKIHCAGIIRGHRIQYEYVPKKSKEGE